MRPEILNPLFTEVEALKGVGPQVAKLLKKLGIDAGGRPALPPADGRDRAGAGAGGERVTARPQRHPRRDTVREPRNALRPRADARSSRPMATATRSASIYFNNPGWAKRQLPKGEKRIVSGKLEAYGDEWQIIHPEVARAGEGAAAGRSRAGLSADRGPHQSPPRRAGARSAGARTGARRMDRAGACSRASAGRRGARRWR